MYSLTLQLNGNTISKKTRDVEKTLASLAPELVHCEMYITVTKGDATNEQRVPLQNARKLFRDPIYRTIFVSNLLIGL